MPIHRRDFMKLLGVSVASLYLARCRPQSTPTPEPTEIYICYEAPSPTDISTPEPTLSSARERLRLYWLRFSELAKKSPEDMENKLGQELVTGHRAELDELTASGEVPTPVADLVHEAYEAAVYHVWRSNAPITCYIIGPSPYDVSSVDVLVTQSQVLNRIAEEGRVDPATLAKAKAALEHDLSYYALSDEEVQSLYEQLRADKQPVQSPPPFDELSLEITPEAKEATQFIIDLLTNK